MKETFDGKADHAQNPGAMKQFNENHWTDKVGETECGGGRYASEMNTQQEYKTMVNKLAGYVRKHRAEH